MVGRMFADRKALRRFADVSNFLEGEERQVFTHQVKSLFDKKILSEEGEFSEFQITESDLNGILLTMKK